MKKTPDLFVEVIIPFALPKNYTWAVPEGLQPAIQVGVRVEVILGKNKRYAGIVKRIHYQAPDSFAPKNILNVLDSEPLLYQEQLDLWEWIAAYYLSTEGDVMQAAIPANLKLSSESILVWNDEQDITQLQLSDAEYLVAEALEIKKELRLSEIQELLDISHVYPVIKKLIEKGICHIWEELKDKYKQKTENYITLHPEFHDEEKLANLLNNWHKAPKQLDLLLSYLYLLKSGEVIQSALLQKSNATLAQLKGLIDKNVLQVEKRATDRIKTPPKNILIDFTLSPAQQQAYAEVLDCLQTKQVCLLHGVTASGKTEIYTQLIETYLQQGKQVLYMLPEIALTSQIIRRLQKHFGGLIAIYHSKFNPNERVEIWNKIKSGETKIVLGARSSLFLPFHHLGLVIADEEHDASYKQQEPAPRYHARDAAIYYASLFKAKVLLGSATPSIESYHNCLLGKYGLVRLAERYGQVELPVIEIVDLKKIAQNNKEKIAITPQLAEAIQQSLQQHEQVILFQNRRGYSPYLLCTTCGWIPYCRQCDVTLTYHKGKHQLSCHYCGSAYPMVTTCTACGSHRFTQKNFGTEKIEELVTEHFPEARIARMDYDTVKGKNEHDALIKIFEEQKLDILVGTQMVVKGLDFAHVNLVGILDADGILNFTDFRVNERAFQLMEQVSGRAGRKDGKGKVLFQVSNVHHPVLGFVQEHDYSALFAYEIDKRKQFGYPPFKRLIQITCKHKEKHIAEEAALKMVEGLMPDYQDGISGPAQPLVDRVRNQYLWEILIKLPRDAKKMVACKQTIRQLIADIQSQKKYRSVTIIPDIDPV